MPQVKDGSVNVNRDTVYVMGDPKDSDSFTQSTLNNNMSGTDANAIYYATHEPGNRRTYTDTRQIGEFPNGAAYNDGLRGQGLKPYTGARGATSMEQGDLYPYAAYVAGAGANYSPNVDEALPMGMGTSDGLMTNWLEGADKYGYNDYATVLSQIVNDPNIMQKLSALEQANAAPNNGYAQAYSDTIKGLSQSARQTPPTEQKVAQEVANNVFANYLTQQTAPPLGFMVREAMNRPDVQPIMR